MVENRATPGKPGFGNWDYLKITILGFAITALWQSLHSIILPIRVLDFVSESQKNTYLGLLTFVGLVLAMFTQPIMGALSDRSRSGWGRRRPYILLGITAAILLLPGIGLGGYAILFASYCLMQVAANTAQGPYQAFIPELVPESKRGLASGMKNLLEILGGVALVGVSSLLMQHYSTGGGSYWLWLNLGTLGMLLALTMLVTILWVKEPLLITQVEKKPFWVSLLGAFKIDLKHNRALVWFLVSRLLVFMAFATVQQFALYFFRDVVGVADPAQATFKFLAFTISGMLLAAYPAGWLCDHIGRRPIAIAAAMLGAVSILLILWLPKEYNLLLAPAALLGIALGAFSSTNWAMATDLVAKGEEARYLGLANVATAGGGALARLIGPVIDFFNARGVNLGYQVMLVFCLVYLAGGALLLLKVRRKN